MKKLAIDLRDLRRQYILLQRIRDPQGWREQKDDQALLDGLSAMLQEIVDGRPPAIKYSNLVGPLTCTKCHLPLPPRDIEVDASVCYQCRDVECYDNH